MSNSVKLGIVDPLYNLHRLINPRVMVIAGAPGTGKTSFCLQSILQILNHAPILAGGKKKLTGIIIREHKKDFDNTVVESLKSILGLRELELKASERSSSNYNIKLKDIAVKTRNNSGHFVHSYYADIIIYMMALGTDPATALGGTEPSFILIEELNTITEPSILDKCKTRVGRDVDIVKDAEPKDAERFNELWRKKNSIGINAKEEEELDAIDYKYRKHSIVFATLNTGIKNKKAAWVKNTLYEKTRYVKSNIQKELEQFGEIRSTRRDNAIILQRGHQVESLICPSPNNYGLGKEYKKNLSNISDPATKRADYYGELTIIADRPPVYGSTYIDAFHFINKTFKFDHSYYLELLESWRGVEQNRFFNKVTEDVIFKNIQYDINTLFVIGLDFGLNPAMACIATTSINGNRYHRVIEEFAYPEGTTKSDHGFSMLVRNFILENGLDTRNLRLVGDPSSNRLNSSTVTSTKSIYDNIDGRGTELELCNMTNNIEDRINAVERMLCLLPNNSNIEDIPLFAFYNQCVNIREGMRGGYVYKDDYDKDLKKPLKDHYSHVQDALQYACLELISIGSYGTSG